MRSKSIAIAVAAAWIVAGYATSVARADGGAVRFSERRGDHLVSVFTSPTPLRAGPVDVSVLLQDSDSGKPVLGTPIVVHARPIRDASQEISAPATSEAATNKLLNAAQLEFAQPGSWRVSVDVQCLNAAPPIDFNVEVAEPLPSWLHLGVWIAWPLVPIGLFACHQWLGQRAAGLQHEPFAMAAIKHARPVPADRRESTRGPRPFLSRRNSESSPW